MRQLHRHRGLHSHRHQPQRPRQAQQHLPAAPQVHQVQVRRHVRGHPAVLERHRLFEGEDVLVPEVGGLIAQVHGHEGVAFGRLDEKRALSAGSHQLPRALSERLVRGPAPKPLHLWLEGEVPGKGHQPLQANQQLSLHPHRAARRPDRESGRRARLRQRQQGCQLSQRRNGPRLWRKARSLRWRLRHKGVRDRLGRQCLPGRRRLEAGLRLHEDILRRFLGHGRGHLRRGVRFRQGFRFRGRRRGGRLVLGNGRQVLRVLGLRGQHGHPILGEFFHRHHRNLGLRIRRWGGKLREWTGRRLVATAWQFLCPGSLLRQSARRLRRHPGCLRRLGHRHRRKRLGGGSEFLGGQHRKIERRLLGHQRFGFDLRKLAQGLRLLCRGFVEPELCTPVILRRWRGRLTRNERGRPGERRRLRGRRGHLRRGNLFDDVDVQLVARGIPLRDAALPAPRLGPLELREASLRRQRHRRLPDERLSGDGPGHLLGHGVAARQQEVLARPPVLALLGQRQPQVVVRLLVVRREIHRHLELAHRALQRIRLQVHEPQVDPQRGVHRVLPHQHLVDLRRPVEEAQLEIRQPEKVLPLLVLRLHLVGPLEVVLGLDHLPGRQQFSAAVEKIQELVVNGTRLRPRRSRRRHRHSLRGARCVRAARALYSGGRAAGPCARTPGSPCRAARCRRTCGPPAGPRCTRQSSSPCRLRTCWRAPSGSAPPLRCSPSRRRCPSRTSPSPSGA
ncbi:hypothetical protein STIAU_7467 [Stigmatella aurantiaca DW4/3-1]|uniref:Uncharacterized protein n=1 Tax=Stigmatella aurantiaca (strain DW4/3-1) TaxID=378806 RepID=Q08Q81_STIAD|nr:hypothetical protein STIAU_7467 [Stigmatella aurantiaca DW4/3-1]